MKSVTIVWRKILIVKAYMALTQATPFGNCLMVLVPSLLVIFGKNGVSLFEI